jgi:hypothetical protein
LQTPSQLQLHLIVDNYSAHKHPKVKTWLARHPRFHMHFTPISASWLNLVKRFFRDLTQGRFCPAASRASSNWSTLSLLTLPSTIWRPSVTSGAPMGTEVLRKIIFQYSAGR